MEAKNAWVCPNDRELTLRARLDTGWSVKSTHLLNTYAKAEQINDVEQQTILKVIMKSQQTERIEKERIGRMVERLNNMKRNAKGDGKHSCVLCNEEFGLFGAQCHLCKDCLKSVCTKCGVDTLAPDKEPLWLCKICSETREMWKKSGAWFLNSLPSLSSSAFCIPSIMSPTSGSTNSLEAECATYSSRSASPVIRRRTRSPSPRSNRQRSPQICDYSTLFDDNKDDDFYDQLNEDEYAKSNVHLFKQSNTYINDN